MASPNGHDKDVYDMEWAGDPAVSPPAAPTAPAAPAEPQPDLPEPERGTEAHDAWRALRGDGHQAF
ncbi:MAG: hypothetical protein COU33_00095 [Candidatus Magasanikbacteria bacterium CG10_big_fil_rev_8_21_14_0_10_43_6]|uniref:Uncharacterized protein n=1 Tax=Candidatus Magasanikbacteria bacterium CG10_big_fil_rev_8_21_14_0_10_43_6 TaxID=1974650 RepID=A0A2M6W2H9_9BACT|nr:MAG: hypothetical protein COU33_00095 [Candidatus Magasanikbacteria bacterium CG10_big_fil_rev_8_21_14_0_10_43_6]